MNVMHNENILHGPEFLEDIPNESYGKTLYHHLQNNYNLPVALVDATSRQSISYKTLFEKSLRLAYSLQKYGITENDVIAISSENSIYYPFPLIAGLWTGATLTTFNPRYAIREIIHVALISKPKLVFCSKASLPSILQIQKELNFIKKIIVIDSIRSEADVESMEDFIVRNSRDYKSFEPVAVDSQNVALIMYSSGTTGLPKGVMLTHYNLNVGFILFKDPRYFVRRPPGTSTTLCCLPFFHALGQTVFSVCLSLGEIALIISRFEERTFLTAIQDFKLKTLWLVPPIANFLANSKLVNNYDLSHVEDIMSGAAPLSKHTVELLFKRFKKVSHIRQGYGLTETTIAVLTPPVGVSKPGSSGILLPETSAKVIDVDTGKSLGPGQKGILLQRAANNEGDPRYFVRRAPGTSTTLCCLPFFHAFGQTIFSVCLSLGEVALIISRFEERTFLRAIQDFKLKTLWLVPPIANFLANSELVKNYDLSHVEVIMSGAAPLSKHIEELLFKRFKKVSHIRQGYGLTEATIAVLTPPIGVSKPGSSGILLPKTSAKVVDIDTGKTLGPEQKGEFYFKGPQIMKGYAGDITSTNNVIDSNGWLRTGDLGHYDEEGFFYIVDRLKDLIKYKGFQVPPAELEGLLLKHPKIVDAAVIGIPDDVAGEVPLAFIVKDADQNLNEDEVKNYIADLVSSQKRLRGGVKFISEIPKNPSGKILKTHLRQLLIQKAKL